jgi:transcriptional regulator with XRE-family HTH domain
MSIATKFENNIAPVGTMLRKAGKSRGYTLGDVAETSGLTVYEVASLENGDDADVGKIGPAAHAVGLDLPWGKYG